MEDFIATNFVNIQPDFFNYKPMTIKENRSFKLGMGYLIVVVALIAVLLLYTRHFIVLTVFTIVMAAAVSIKNYHNQMLASSMLEIKKQRKLFIGLRNDYNSCAEIVRYELYRVKVERITNRINRLKAEMQDKKSVVDIELYEYELDNYLEGFQLLGYNIPEISQLTMNNLHRKGILNASDLKKDFLFTKQFKKQEVDGLLAWREYLSSRFDYYPNSLRYFWMLSALDTQYKHLILEEEQMVIKLIEKAKALQPTIEEKRRSTKEAILDCRTKLKDAEAQFQMLTKKRMFLQPYIIK
ncbi:MAG: hypothetical protein EOO43_16210 [Flavobacterium sp.]|nr:MAG: hypothetical protein EOO43_16210 [Flavobacterium sp.]